MTTSCFFHFHWSVIYIVLPNWISTKTDTSVVLLPAENDTTEIPRSEALVSLASKPILLSVSALILLIQHTSSQDVQVTRVFIRINRSCLIPAIYMSAVYILTAAGSGLTGCRSKV